MFMSLILELLRMKYEQLGVNPQTYQTSSWWEISPNRCKICQNQANPGVYCEHLE